MKQWRAPDIADILMQQGPPAQGYGLALREGATVTPEQAGYLNQMLGMLNASGPIAKPKGRKKLKKA